MTDADRQPYRFTHPVEVRFKDIDVGGHAHHSHALVYFEEARAAYWREVVGRVGPGTGEGGIDYILAEATIRWHHRVHWPARLSVSTRVSFVGRKHFVMDYRVASPEGELLVSGSTTQVMYDYAADASKRLPAEVRAGIERFEGPFGRGGKWAGEGVVKGDWSDV
jgi:acyl-CoA thioester hydrolase